MRSLASWSGILGVASSILAAALGGLQFSDYSHVSQYLSEAYAAGTPYGHLLRYFLLVPSGALIMVFGLLLGREFRHSRLLWLGFLGIAMFYGLSMAVGSVFPCDAGCNRELETPSWSHVIHLTSGALTHAFVPGSLLMIAFAARKQTGGNIIAGATFMAAAVCAVCNTFLAIDPLSPFAGLFQRGFEGSILCWIAIVAVAPRYASATPRVAQDGLRRAIRSLPPRQPSSPRAADATASGSAPRATTRRAA
jgi:uncharacterized protein DUF998